MSRRNTIFADWAPRFREVGCWPRPVTVGSKACHWRDWQTPDSQLSADQLEDMLRRSGTSGIALLMGSPFPDGTRLGAIDVDNDDYVRLAAALLGQPICGRVGSKGIAYFVRIRGEPEKARSANPEFRVRGSAFKHLGKVVECLFTKKICVIPPTIHPGTGKPYRWAERSLLEVSYEELPIMEHSQ